MFSMSSSPSSRFQNQEAGLNRALVQKYTNYHELIKLAASNMISEFDKLKNALEIAVDAYLKKIEHKFFRKDGRKRAETFKNKISNMACP